MQSAEITSMGALGVGTIYAQEAQFLGRKIVSIFEIVAYEVGHLIKGKSIAGSFPITFTRTVRGHAQGCIATEIVEGDASGVFRVAAPLMKRMVQRTVRGDYANLKRLLEQREK